jgi:hypothetical protein
VPTPPPTPPYNTTRPTPAPAPRHKSDATAPAVGAACGLLILGAVVFVDRRRRRRWLLGGDAKPQKKGGGSIGAGLFGLFRFRAEPPHDDRMFDVPLLRAAPAAGGVGVVSIAAAPARRGPQVFVPAEMEAATDGFGEASLLDEGTFGAVFRGVLASGRAVAIKVLKPEAAANLAKGEMLGEFEGAGGFRKELEVLSRYRHKNIVRLLGFSLSAELSGRSDELSGWSQASSIAVSGLAAKLPKQCLVFELMGGGSLSKRLRGRSAALRRAKAAATRAAKKAAKKEVGALPEPLTAQERFDIASDVARGLEYLHIDADPPIIHQDVKSDNILLSLEGGRLVAKVADFGAARIAPTLLKKHKQHGTHHSTSHIVGTGPYMPMEYIQMGHVSEKVICRSHACCSTVLHANSCTRTPRVSLTPPPSCPLRVSHACTLLCPESQDGHVCLRRRALRAPHGGAARELRPWRSAVFENDWAAR